jgi:hypothetical protein
MPHSVDRSAVPAGTVLLRDDKVFDGSIVGVSASRYSGAFGVVASGNPHSPTRDRSLTLAASDFVASWVRIRCRSTVPISIGKPGRPLCDVLHSSVLISSCSDVSGRLCSNNALYAGCLLPVGKHVEFNSYYENENNIGGHNDHPENAVGLALYLLLSADSR